MIILFRTDASIEIGTGHVMRCLTLAAELQNAGYKPHFVCRAHPGNLIPLVVRRGYEVHSLLTSKLPDSSENSEEYTRWLGASWQADADETIEVIDTLNRSGSMVAGLVVDHYALDGRWENRIKTSITWIGVIDDLANRPHECDLLLDQNLYHAPESRYAGLIPTGCLRLIGPKFTLLRPEFLTLRTKRGNAPTEVRRLLVFFGGTDTTNETAKALNAIASLPSNLVETTVVIGEHHPHKEMLKSLCESLESTRLLIQVDNMAELMAEADLAIGAGGTTSWERCCLGLPCLALCIAENQRLLLEVLHEAGALRNLGYSQNVTSGVLAQNLLDLISDPRSLMEMRLKAASLVDGLGAQRVAMEMIQAIRSKNSDAMGRGLNWALRRVMPEDKEMIFSWSNDLVTREASFQSAPIPLQDHESWFSGQLMDPNSYFYVLEINGRPSGQIRFKREGTAAIIGFLVSPDSRGLGLSSVLLMEGVKRLHKDCPEVTTLRGMVKKTNIPSIKAFQKAGFSIEKDTIVSRFESWIFWRHGIASL